METMPAWLADERANQARMRYLCAARFDKLKAQFDRGLITVDEYVDEMIRVRHTARVEVYG